MKLREALEVIREGRKGDREPLSIVLACGSEALHLKTFLTAHLQKRFPSRTVDVRTGVYGDLAGTVERAADAADAVEAVAVVLEWSDLDPRLGIRAVGGWSPDRLDDIVRTVESAGARLRAAIERLSERSTVVLCPPTLPLPPVALTPIAQASAFEIDLEGVVAALTAWAVRQRRVRVVRAQRLDEISPVGERVDVDGAIRVGFPYRLGHADAVAELLAALVASPSPKKGLITDLDDTLWRGLLGEAGVGGVRWDLADGAQVHALYQQLLGALAERGVLVGVASKNDAGLVEDALRHPDLLLRRDQLYPVEAGWGAKSEAVERILRAWNVSADSVVFVDDTAMELAEVAAAHPGIETIRFPNDDPAAVWSTLVRLRDLFGKTALTDEDRVRAASLRATATADAPVAGAAGFEQFLAGAEAEVSVDFRLDADDPRALELVNKTNQFTLNGRRYTDGGWRALLGRPDAFLLRVGYRDRFGPLGTIAVLGGRREGPRLAVDVWAMSCRAFSRRIEHQCLRQLVRRFAVEELVFDYVKTDRNGPLQALFATLLGTSPGGAGVSLSVAELDAACPRLYHTVREVSDA